jgi:hypothetical protein
LAERKSDMTSTDWKEIAAVARKCGHAHGPSQVAFDEFARQCEKQADSVPEPADDKPAVAAPPVPQVAPKADPPKVETPKTDVVKAS